MRWLHSPKIKRRIPPEVPLVSNVVPSLDEKSLFFFRCNDHQRETTGVRVVISDYSFKLFGGISCHKINVLHKLRFSSRPL